MKIAYVLSTCEKYEETRVKYQKKNSLYEVPEEDIYYLSSSGSTDLPEEIMKKYLLFFDNNARILLKYDWVFLGDDDTFVYTNRLEKYLIEYNPNDKMYIGHLLNHLKESHCEYHSGGAGYIISKSLWKEIFSRKRDRYAHWCDDLCIGLWINEIEEVQKIDDKINFKQDNELGGITSHRMRTKEDYEFHNKIMVEETSCIVTLSDDLYLENAFRTIKQVRTTGKWNGKIKLLYIGNKKIINDETEIINIEKLDTTELYNYLISINGFKDSDKRELKKMIQWSKLKVFEQDYIGYEKVLFIDAGAYIHKPLIEMLSINTKGSIIAPRDTGYKGEKLKFENQLDNHNPELKKRLIGLFKRNEYFINCLFVFDAKLKLPKYDIMEYPIFRTNEMGLMNVLLSEFWKEMDEKYFTYHPSNWDYTRVFTITKYI